MPRLRDGPPLRPPARTDRRARRPRRYRYVPGLAPRGPGGEGVILEEMERGGVSCDPLTQLVVLCEVCRRPSNKQCWTCKMRICDFCVRKQHWKGEFGLHWPLVEKSSLEALGRCARRRPRPLPAALARLPPARPPAASPQTPIPRPLAGGRWRGSARRTPAASSARTPTSAPRPSCLTSGPSGPRRSVRRKTRVARSPTSGHWLATGCGPRRRCTCTSRATCRRGTRTRSSTSAWREVRGSGARRGRRSPPPHRSPPRRAATLGPPPPPAGVLTLQAEDSPALIHRRLFGAVSPRAPVEVTRTDDNRRALVRLPKAAPGDLWGTLFVGDPVGARLLAPEHCRRAGDAGGRATPAAPDARPPPPPPRADPAPPPRSPAESWTTAGTR